MAERPAASGLAAVGPTLAYAVVIEVGQQGYGAYVPDLPGCVAAGGTAEEVTNLIREAIALHLAAMAEAGEPISEPRTQVVMVSVALEGNAA